MKTKTLIFCLAMSLASLSGCSTYQPEGPSSAWRAQDGTLVEADHSPDFEPMPVPDSYREAPPRTPYTLHVGDLLVVDVSGSENLHEVDVLVGPDGEVSLPLVGALSAEGRSLKDLRKEIQREYLRYFTNAITSVRLSKYRIPTCNVLGQVNRPGAVEIEGTRTLTDVIARAEGFRHVDVGRAYMAADLSGAYVARGDHIVPVNFRALFEHGDLSHNITIYPNDLVYIPDIQSRVVYVLGFVNKPGPVPLDTKGLSVLSALAGAQGPKDIAKLNNIAVVRNVTSKPLVRVINAEDLLSGRVEDFQLKPGDVLYVPRDDIRSLDLHHVLHGVSQAVILGAIN